MKFFVCLCLAANAFAGEYAILNTGFRIHAERHETVGSLVRLYTGQGLIEVPASSVVRFEAEDFVATPPAPSVPVVPGLKASPSPQKLLDSAARKYGLPPEFLRSVAAVESGYRPDAVSPKGAIGLMQLMPATAAKLDADPGNPEQNVDAGARHLRELLLKYDGGVYRALAAYNAGSGAVERYNGIPPYRETQLYVQRVVELYRKLAGKPHN